MQKIWNIGAIGCGAIAEYHIRSIGELEQARLVAVSSRREEKAKEVAAREGCEWTTDYRDLLSRSDIDVVCITTSSGSHARIGLEAIRAGKHVIVEKPIAMTAEEAKAMVREAESRGTALSVISQTRFEPHVLLAKRAVDEGRLGRLLLIEAFTPYLRTQAYYDSADWRGTLAEDGGALMNQGIHYIDLLLWMGGRARSVFGKTATQTHRMEAEDLGLAFVTFEGGHFGSLMSSTSIQPGFAQQLHIYGEQGTIKLEGGRIVHWTVPSMEAPADASASQAAAVPGSNPLFFSHENHKRQIADALHAIEAGSRMTGASGEDGARTVELVHAIYESSKTGKEVTL